MTDYEYAQAVMAAAGVDPLYRWVVGTHEVSCFSAPNQDACIKWRDEHFNYCVDNDYDVCRWDRYPDPLTSGDAFLALWDALVTKGYVVRITVYPTRMTCVRMFSHVEDTFTAGEADDADRRVALVEAAGQALGVSRAA